MVKEYGFSHRLWRWLERFGFTDDPFAVYEADQERPDLPFFFVHRPYLYDVLGNPARPQPAFLMAGRGGGKTATREMVAYECRHGKLRRRALAVGYYDFSPLLEQTRGDLNQLSARHHIRTITRYALKALVDDVPAAYFDRLEEKTDRELLMGYAATFADPISHLKLTKILADEPTRLDWDALTDVETLGIFASLVAKLGQSSAEESVEPESTVNNSTSSSNPRKSQTRYQALYILIDRVDETAFGSEAAVPILKPLVSDGSLLKVPHVAFKFFLPTEVGKRLRPSIALNAEHLCIRSITWNETSLREMVEQRLSYFSQDRVKRLEELCTSGAKVSAMERLIRACEGSPRTLLRLCRALIHHHVAVADETSTLITHTELIDTLRDFEHRLEVERMPPSPAVEAITTPSVPISPPESGLFLDQNGHAWVDGQTLSPPLSQLEFRLLDALYRHAPEIVSHEALIEAVWPPSAWMSNEDVQGRDEQNLRKLVDRLRKRLPGRASRFIRNARGRGYWLKIQENSVT